MKNYTFQISEVLNRTIEIKAHNEDEAYKKVSKMYTNEEIILSADDFSHVSIHKASLHDKDTVISEIIDYLYLDEQEHYAKNPESNHIYLKMKLLKELLD